MKRALLLLIVVCVAALCLRGCSLASTPAERAAAAAVHARDQAIAAKLQEMAERIEAGRLRGQGHERQWLAKQLVPLLDQAFEPVYGELWPVPGRPDEQQTARAARELSRAFKSQQ